MKRFLFRKYSYEFNKGFVIYYGTHTSSTNSFFIEKIVHSPETYSHYCVGDYTAIHDGTPGVFITDTLYRSYEDLLKEHFTEML